MKPKSALRSFLALAGSSMLAISSSHAATYYWDVNGNGTDNGFSTVVGAWNTGAFWNTNATGGTGGTITAATTDADDLIIAQAVINTGSITVTGSKTASSITFAPDVGPTALITGGTLVIGGTGSYSGIRQQSSGANSIASAITLNSAYTAFNFSNSSTGLLTISGAVTGGASATQTVTVGSSGTGDIIFTGAISNGSGGTVALDVNSAGAGVTTLSGNNNRTFSGGVTLTAGTLRATGNTGALGAGTLALNGGILDLADSTARAFNRNTTVGANAKIISQRAIGANGGGVTHTLGTLGIGANTLTVQGGDTVTSGTAGVTFGATTLSGNAIFDVLPASGGGNTLLTLGALNQSGGSRSLTKRGAGTLTLSGASDLAGGLNIEAGIVTLGNTTAAGAGLVTLGVSGDATFGTLNLSGGSRDIHSLATVGTAASQIITSSSTGGVLNYNGATTSNFGGVITGSTASFTSLTVNNASANLTLSGTTANTYTGLTTVTNGTLVLNKSGAVNAMGGSLTINGGMVQYNTAAGSDQIANSVVVTLDGGTFDMNSKSDTLGSLVYNSGTISNVAGPLILANQGLTALSMRNTTIGFDVVLSRSTINGVGLTFDATNNGTATISGGLNINSSGSGNATRTFTINDGTAAIDMDISGVISSTTPANLTKTGLGTLQFSGINANTYGGTTTVSAGVLNTTKAVVLPGYNVSGKVVINGGTLGVRVGGAGWTTTEVNTLLTNATKTSGALGIDTTNASLTQWAAFTTTNLGSTLGLTKLGSNTLTLDQSNTYTGATTISAGTLEVQGSIASSNGITNNAALTFNSASAQSYGNVIGGTGSLTKTGIGTLTLSGDNLYTGATLVTDGKLIVNGSISTSILTTVQTGATLGGSGTVGALTIDSGGIFAPGNSPGIETVNGNYIQNGTLQIEIEGLAAGNTAGTHDQVVVNGTVTLNGLLSLTTFTGTYTANDLIFILLNDSTDAITGTFTGLTQGVSVGTYAGFNWQISYLADSTANTFTGTLNGNDIALKAIAIPEPRAALLGGIGMLLLLRRRRN